MNIQLNGQIQYTFLEPKDQARSELGFDNHPLESGVDCDQLEGMALKGAALQNYNTELIHRNKHNRP